jgi:hypothetical protein
MAKKNLNGKHFTAKEKIQLNLACNAFQRKRLPWSRARYFASGCGADGELSHDLVVRDEARGFGSTPVSTQSSQAMTRPHDGSDSAMSSEAYSKLNNGNPRRISYDLEV